MTISIFGIFQCGMKIYAEKLASNIRALLIVFCSFIRKIINNIVAKCPIL